MFDQPHGHTVRQRHDGSMDRPNTELAHAVEHALTMDDVRAAAAFLAGHGAGFALTCRVLAEPTKRRQTCQIGQIDRLTPAKLP